MKKIADITRDEESRIIFVTKDEIKFGAVWIGTIEIPRFNYEKYYGKLSKLGIFEVKDFSHNELLLDGSTYQLRAKSVSKENSVTLHDPTISESKALGKLIREVDRILEFPKYRLERVSRFDRIAQWIKQLRS